MTRLNVTPAQIAHYREQEERRRAFREELPLEDTPGGASTDQEAFGHGFDDTEQHEGPTPRPLISAPSEWILEDNDMQWIHAPVHSHEELQPDGTMKRVYDEHVELDNGLFFDQDLERNRGAAISPHTVRARAILSGDTRLLRHLNERFLLDAALEPTRAARREAQEAGFVDRKVKFFAAVRRHAARIGITDPDRLREYCVQAAAVKHPEYLNS